MCIVESMINLRQVRKTYDTPAGAFTALDAIDLDIERGEFVAIVGKSGSGKTTLLNMIGGIDVPTSGSVRVNKSTVEEMSRKQIAAWRGRTVGFVFQFFQLLPTLTAVENVMLPMDFCGTRPQSQRRKYAEALLDRVGVKNQSDKLPATLSGGQQQRVAIARALANDPPVILADEPTGNLDSTTSETIFELFAELCKEGRTIVVVTHERAEAAAMGTVVTIADGCVAP